MPRYRDTFTDEWFDSSDLIPQVLCSPAGYYIGQVEPGGAPFSRLSDYFDKKEDAEKAFKSEWSDRGAPENTKVVNELVEKGIIKKF